MSHAKQTRQSRVRLRLVALIYTVLSMALLLTLAACTPAPEEPVGRWGVINEQGEWVVEPQYFNSGERFVGNRLEVNTVFRANETFGNWGYLDREGNWAIEPAHYEAHAFSQDGIARVSNIKGTRWGFINTQGEWVIETEFFSVGDFASNGLAPARSIRQYQRGYIDREGNWAIEPTFDGAEEFSSSGYAVVRKSPNDLYCVIDSEGTIVLETELLLTGSVFARKV